ARFPARLYSLCAFDAGDVVPGHPYSGGSVSEQYWVSQERGLYLGDLQCLQRCGERLGDSTLWNRWRLSGVLNLVLPGLLFCPVGSLPDGAAPSGSCPLPSKPMKRSLRAFLKGLVGWPLRHLYRQANLCLIFAERRALMKNFG